MKDAHLRTSAVLLLLLLSFLLPSGCGYHVAGRAEVKEVTPGGKPGGMPWGIKTLSIPFFKNLTGRPDIERVLTAALVDEFMNIVDIVPPGKGDAVMEGVVKNYRIKPVSYTSNDIVSAYRLTVVMSIRIVRASDGEMLWRDEGVADYEDFSVDPNNVLSTKDAERTALEKIARDRARILKERILEDF